MESQSTNRKELCICLATAVVFLSFLDAETTSSFVNWARTEIARQSSPLARRLGPAISGLELVVSGKTFDQRGSSEANTRARRFLGWSTGQHWLLAPESASVAQDHEVHQRHVAAAAAALKTELAKNGKDCVQAHTQYEDTACTAQTAEAAGPNLPSFSII